MSSEETKLNNSEENINQPTSGEAEASSPQSASVHVAEPAPAPTPAAPAPTNPVVSSTAESAADEDEDESRASGDVDFGQLLDQFEQEQASLQEGEVVRGIVVGISERGVVIDFGYKSEGVVNPAEFIENGVMTVRDEVEVLVKAMDTHEGLPVCRADAGA
jgi:small subunit ribosomal protein S1